MVKIIKKLKASEFGMRLREKFYPKYDPDPNTSPRQSLAKSMKRFSDCDSKKSASQIRAEINLCKKFWKCFPYHYYLYDLYRQDMQLSESALLNFIPNFFWYYLYLPHHTSYRYWMISDNKIFTECYFKSNNIAQPDTLCKIINGSIYSSDMNLLNFDKLKHNLRSGMHRKLFMKPAESGRGLGFYVFHRNEEGEFLTSNNTMLTLEFLKTEGQKKAYIIQYGIVQHPALDSIFPGAVNTIRIITENKEGNVSVLCAMLRMGRGRGEIDNASAGGIFIKIDLKSGKLGNFASSYECEKFFRHPDTAFEFKNIQIPLWTEVLTFVRVSAEKIPYFTHLAWDIALTPGGPIAIEINLGAGVDGLQISHGGLRETFGIDNPDYYWKNLGKRSEHVE
jgi:hypothetical protein